MVNIDWVNCVRVCWTVAERVNTQLMTRDTGRLFAVVHLVGKQRKVTIEDIIVLDKHYEADIGQRIRLNKVTWSCRLIGSWCADVQTASFLPPVHLFTDWYAWYTEVNRFWDQLKPVTHCSTHNQYTITPADMVHCYTELTISSLTANTFSWQVKFLITMYVNTYISKLQALKCYVYHTM